jgi:hypothetical protein
LVILAAELVMRSTGAGLSITVPVTLFRSARLTPPGKPGIMTVLGVEGIVTAGRVVLNTICFEAAGPPSPGAVGKDSSEGNPAVK